MPPARIPIASRLTGRSGICRSSSPHRRLPHTEQRSNWERRTQYLWTFTFFATAGVVARLGARPVFADIDPVTFNIDPNAVATFLARGCEVRAGTLVNKATGGIIKALMPVHLYGAACDMDKVMAALSAARSRVTRWATSSPGSSGTRPGRRSPTSTVIVSMPLNSPLSSSSESGSSIECSIARRSGRAGRSGQAALVLTYCAALSPHDQYFFREPKAMVHGEVRPPLLDLANRDLLEVVRALALIREGNVTVAVDYRNLGSEELGSIYESLLAYHPELHPGAVDSHGSPLPSLFLQQSTRANSR